ncbi:MAG: hypothetical protein EAZ89_09170 [Bacteroidetes bacterium]|nr:MAG: hypothetical protein EAZ89_09170 [Bacteroidota bacterium]
MKLLISTLLTLLPLAGLVAQKSVRSEGEYQLNLTRSGYSEAEGCAYCQEMAMVQAIEKEFGTVVIQGNSTSLRNTQVNHEVQTEQVFNMIAETYVNGEWIKTLDESCERFTDGGEFWLRCQVKGVVSELKRPDIELNIKSLDCPELSCETFDFRDGEPLYLYLKSPKRGYISIYMADPKVAQRLLPYRQMPENLMEAVEIEGDKDYVFFSRQRDQLNLASYVDEYELFAETEADLSRIYVLFSEKPMGKPVLNEAARTDMPPELDPAEFQKWLARQRRHNPDLAVFRIDLSIRK